MNVEVDRAVEEYLAGVRAALADLPASEVADIVDEVRGHLADVRGEVGQDAGPAVLTARLGTPAAYAAELRVAAGYPPAPQAGGRRAGTAVLAVAVLVAATLVMLLGGVGVLDGGGLGLLPIGLVVAALLLLLAVPELARGGPRLPRVAALPVVRRLAAALREPRGVLGFVVSLQPAWWVLRALVAVALVGGLLLGGGLVAWLLLSAVFVPLSVALGHLSRRDRRWVWPVVPLNAFAAALLPALFGVFTPVVATPSDAGSYGPYPGLWQDGEQVTDVRPVDATGQPLSGVYLFDQDGRPLDVGRPCDGYDSYSGYDSYDGDGGTASTDPYPRGSARFDDETGACRVVPPAPLVVAVPSATASGAPTQLPTPPAPPASVLPAPAEPAPTGAAPTEAAPPAPPVTTEPVPSPAPPTG